MLFLLKTKTKRQAPQLIMRKSEFSQDQNVCKLKPRDITCLQTDQPKTTRTGDVQSQSSIPSRDLQEPITGGARCRTFDKCEPCQAVCLKWC